MIKLKDILLEKAYKSGKLFVMKSPYSPKHMPYDHIGFITDDGEIIDMSGHRYTKDGKKPLPPKKYKYEDTEDLFKMPKNKEEAIEKGLYKEIPLHTLLIYLSSKELARSSPLNRLSILVLAFIRS